MFVRLVTRRLWLCCLPLIGSLDPFDLRYSPLLQLVVGCAACIASTERRSRPRIRGLDTSRSRCAHAPVAGPMADLVSIIMPLHNAERYVGAAIESCIHQTYPEWELIVVDDASTDASAAIVESVDDKRVRL